ncbi:cbb3-type cytochrome oxidase assembly protein CcoS [Chitinophaga costaii]|nr:cbb3-type cytochrome oxidase assembly protein CcoS [Chitinophaga costaii]
MSVIILLLLSSISVAALFLAGFLWSVKSGQYDDADSPPVRILFDPSSKTADNILDHE